MGFYKKDQFPLERKVEIVCRKGISQAILPKDKKGKTNMGLVAWYKLDGNALDSSGNNLHGTAGGVSYVGGKIGQAGFFSSSYVSLDTPISSVGDFSVSFWGLTTSTGTQNFACSRTSVGEGFSIFLLNGYLRFDTNSAFQWTTSYSYPLNTWVHITVTKTSQEKKLFVNGTLHSSTTDVPNVPLSLSSTYTFGASHSNGTAWSNYLEGKVDDYRIYNHALSEKEINELSKGKVLHYTFDDFQEPTENKYDLNVSYNRWSSSSSNMTTLDTKTGKHSFKVEGVCNVPGAYLYVYPYFETNAVLTTLSAKVKNNNTKELRVDITMKEYGNKSDIIDNTKSFYIQPYRIEYIYLTSEGITTNSGYTPAFSVYSDSIDGKVNAEVYDIQLEEKDHATPFTPTIRTGLVKDISGYENNAVLDLNTTPRWMEEGIIGKGSYLFNGTTSGIERTGDISDIKTILMWVKSQTVPTDSRVLLIHQPTGVGLGFYNNGYLILTSTGNSQRTAIISNFKNNDWNHIAVTYSDAKVPTCYINGVETTYSTTNNWYVPETTLFIGRRTSGSAFDGQIDDVRIYATALSADDIKELYKTRASLDNRGNFFAGGFTAHIDAIIDNILIGKGIPLESSFLITDIHGGI